MVILLNLMFCFSLFPDCGHVRIQINPRELQNILKFSKSKCRKEYWEMPFSINTSVINLNLSRDKDSNTIHDEFKGIFCSWWCHPMETFSALLALGAGNSPVTGELPSQRPVTQIFDVFFDALLNKRFSKQPTCWWIESHCAHYDITVIIGSLGQHWCWVMELVLSFKVSNHFIEWALITQFSALTLLFTLKTKATYTLGCLDQYMCRAWNLDLTHWPLGDVAVFLNL